jgi:hypothetical protein
MARKGFEQQRALPTVSHYRTHEVCRLLVICRSERIPGYLCHHEGTLALDGLPDCDLFELGNRLRFRCSKCGGSKVELRPDWRSRPITQPVYSARGWILFAAQKE